MGLLKDILAAVAEAKTNVVSVNARVRKDKVAVTNIGADGDVTSGWTHGRTGEANLPCGEGTGRARQSGGARDRAACTLEGVRYFSTLGELSRPGGALTGGAGER